MTVTVRPLPYVLAAFAVRVSRRQAHETGYDQLLFLFGVLTAAFDIKRVI